MRSYLAYLKSPAIILRGSFCGVNKVLNKFMELAFQEARKGKSTWLNPLVGAVIVKNQKVIGLGHHETFGHEHAEINALKSLTSISDAKGATLFVTLEPCSHVGKTPPCVQKIFDVGITKVVIGQVDPNPIVSGRGIKYLENHNIQVENLNIKTDLNTAYEFFYREQRPLITIKYAMTLDGKINRDSVKHSLISNHESYLDSQKLRANNQVILIGENTLKLDNPRLTVREEAKLFPPIRAILVRDLKTINKDLKIFQNEAPIWFFTEKQTDQIFPNNVKVLVGNWTPESIITYLAEQKLQSILIEGGSHIQADFMQAKLVDKLIIYLANRVFGTGLSAVSGQTIKGLEFSKPIVKSLDSDLKITVWRKR